MNKLDERLHALVTESDARAATVREHFLHAIGVDEKQLTHDAETAATPVVAEAEHDAQDVVQQAAVDVTHPGA